MPDPWEHSWPASNRVQFLFPLVLYFRICHNEYVLTLKIIKWSKNITSKAALQTTSVMKGWIWGENGERSVQNLTLSPLLLTRCRSMLSCSICFSFGFWVVFQLPELALTLITCTLGRLLGNVSQFWAFYWASFVTFGQHVCSRDAILSGPCREVRQVTERTQCRRKRKLSDAGDPSSDDIHFIRHASGHILQW